MDFILQMYSKDHPDEFKLIGKDIMKGEAEPQIYVEWSNKLCGEARKEFDRNPIAYLKKHYNWTKK